jgi:hypothetical protein
MAKAARNADHHACIIGASGSRRNVKTTKTPQRNAADLHVRTRALPHERRRCNRRGRVDQSRRLPGGT